MANNARILRQSLPLEHSMLQGLPFAGFDDTALLAFYEQQLGKVAATPFNAEALAGYWQGRILSIASDIYGPGTHIYASCGLSDPEAFAGERDAGLGYELLVISQGPADWALQAIAQTLYAEVVSEAGFLEIVEAYDGMTTGGLDIGAAAPVNLMITKAFAPLPRTLQSAAGPVEMLVITVINDEEVTLSRKSGTPALLKQLISQGVGQLSDLERVLPKQGGLSRLWSRLTG
ncbi:suppressor of fused domain protein [Chitinimonas sp. JJ19]|uniref:suppressor of fused domain protein n=1 Tax=Chitinimonas sp. JJ19 TaxID=3109352 RepID=UPI0030013396